MFSILRDKLLGGIRELVKAVVEKQLDEGEAKKILEKLKFSLIEGDVAFETSEKICSDLKKTLTGKLFSRLTPEDEIKAFFKKELLAILDKGEIKLEELAKKEKPLLILFLGFNGAGKTTNLAKLAHFLKQKGFSVVLAAADTYRAASIEQLEIHAQRVGIPVIKQKYGADPAAVIYDARQYAKSKGIDFILADTAGRSHSNANLMDELSKIIRVNRPPLRLLVIDSLAGNDALEQARAFEKVGIDGFILTKMDVNEKGGAALSVCHATGKPILFVGTGQGYADLRPFDRNEFVRRLID